MVSDTHGDEGALQRAVQAQPSARTVIHLGDGAREAEAVAARFPDRMFWQVRGNGDFALGSAGLLYAREETLGGKRLFFTHGHLYGVKTGLYRVCCAARERQADILLFGHTHQPLTDYDDGLYILNPGSLRGRGTYGLLDVTPTGVAPERRGESKMSGAGLPGLTTGCWAGRSFRWTRWIPPTAI